MAVEDDNVALLRRCYDRWVESKGSSVEDWMAIAADDIRLRIQGGAEARADCPGERCGHEALRTYLASVDGNWEMLDYEVAETIAQDDRVVVVVRSRFRNRHTSKAVDLPMVNLWRLRGGKVVEFAEFYDTASLLEALKPR